MKKLFTSECVRAGHPDKICDLISDTLLDAYLKTDKNSRVAIETMATKNKIIVSGEVTSNSKPDINGIVKNTLNRLGYFDDYEVLVFLTEQSNDISIGVNKKILGAGDQGIMFGYATNETPYYLPLTQVLVNKQTKKIDNSNLNYLKPDGKCQITSEYDDDKIKRIDTIVVSVQTDDVDINIIRRDITNLIYEVLPNDLLDESTKILINPTGRFVIGGPLADTGLTGRKIIIDTYSGFAKHGGGAFSGKDYTKVDRSAAYYLRYVCKNIVASGLCDKIEIQISYAISLPKEISLNINCFNTNKIDEDKILEIIKENFDFSPSNIIKELNLKNIKYQTNTNYSHFFDKDLPWEKLDKTDILKKYLK